MSDEIEELDLELLEVDPETGEVRKSEKPLADVPIPSTRRYSNSLIEDYNTCPAKAYARLTRQPSTKGVSLITGIAVHEALEHFIKEEKDPVEYYAGSFKAEAEKNKLVTTGKAEQDSYLAGIKCVAAGKAILMHRRKDGQLLYQTLDRDLVEAYFTFERDGILFVGKNDFAANLLTGAYIIGDWKTGKNAPTQFELDTGMQFTMYAKGMSSDPKLKTFGRWPERMVWMHLRGQAVDFHPSGKRKSVAESSKPPRYDFPTTRTPEQVETAFRTKIDPVVAQMEREIWYRKESKWTCGMCSYFDKGKERCGAEIPLDKPPAQDLSLFGTNADTVLTESKAAALHDYTGEPG